MKKLTAGFPGFQKPLTIKKGTWQIKEIQDQERWPYHDAPGAPDQRVIASSVVSGEGAIAQPSGGKIPVTIEWKPTHFGGLRHLPQY